MLVFHELAYEGYVLAEETGLELGLKSDPRFMELIGAVDVLHIGGYSAHATGTTPTLTIFAEYSNDRNDFTVLTSGVQPINNLSLSTTGETLFQGVYTDTTLARLAYGRLFIRVSGTNARAFLRIWVTGRDLSRRSAGASQAQRMARQLPRTPNGTNGMNGMYGSRR
jgi:hypothetical protein